MSKFVQEFKTAEILQLRMNHNFTNVDLTQAAQNQMTIIALEFER